MSRRLFPDPDSNLAQPRTTTPGVTPSPEPARDRSDLSSDLRPRNLQAQVAPYTSGSAPLTIAVELAGGTSVRAINAPLGRAQVRKNCAQNTVLK